MFRAATDALLAPPEPRIFVYRELLYVRVARLPTIWSAPRFGWSVYTSMVKGTRILYSLVTLFAWLAVYISSIVDGAAASEARMLFDTHPRFENLCSGLASTCRKRKYRQTLAHYYAARLDRAVELHKCWLLLDALCGVRNHDQRRGSTTVCVVSRDKVVRVMLQRCCAKRHWGEWRKFF